MTTQIGGIGIDPKMALSIIYLKLMSAISKFQDDFTVLLVKTHLCLEGKNCRLFMTLWGSIQTDFRFFPVRFFAHSISIIYKSFSP
jgi:hypothetical protein